MSSAEALAAAGLKAVAAGKYADGIEKLSQALKDRPAPLWLLERSKAYVRANQIDLALHDAEKALHISFQRANRDLMTECQIRRSVALFRMGRYADADICAFWALRLTEGARATEDDGQQNKVDGNGDYTSRVDEVTAQARPDPGSGLATAMGSSGRSRDASLKNQAISWRVQALTHLEKLCVGDPGRKVTVTEKYPNIDGNTPAQGSKTVSASNRNPGDNTIREAWERFREMHSKKAIRSSFYQTETTLTTDIFVKNTDAARFSVTADEQKITTGESPSIQLHLWGKIKPDETKYTVKPMKIELVLRKETPGKWPMLVRENAAPFSKLSSAGPTLEQFTSLLSLSRHENPDDLHLPAFEAGPDVWYSSLMETLQASLDGPKAPEAKVLRKDSKPATEAAAPTRTGNVPMQPQVNPSSASKPADDSTPTSAKGDSAKTSAAGAPAYPTSSKRGAVNWDKLEDVDDDEAEHSDVNSFFQKLYKDSDENTRRAMMKSYVESNGTSLSTNWDEARETTYKTKPPEGVEAKEWD